MPHKTESIVLGGGCFWCLEAVYQQIKGIESVISGYAGGDTPNPTYENHGTHAEVVQVTFDPLVISLQTILEVFWHIHDPTTLNQQGADIGESYRSIILYTNDTQKSIIETSLKDVATPLWPNKVVTEIKKLETFYKAEDYQQNFYKNNTNVGYCQVVINPKLAKFEKTFASLIK